MGEFVETFFGEGSLGVVLRRRAEDGIVFVHEIIPESQAVHINVLPGDELWTVGDSEIGQTPLDKEAWNGLIAFIKQSNRPLRMIWHRKPILEVKDPTLDDQSQNFNPSAGAESTAPSNLQANEQAEELPVSYDSQSSPQYQELLKVLSRISHKEKDSTPSLASFLSVGTTQSRKGGSFPDPMSLVVDGRRILRIGDLNIESKPIPPLWLKSVSKRRIVLMNDLLLIAAPSSGNMFNLEYLIDLPISKISSFGHSFGLGGTDEDLIPRNESSDSEETLTFGVIWPGGEVKLIADNKESKDIWILNIFLAICETVTEEGRVLGWRHQYLLGTMHSAVLSRSEDRVRELIQYHEQRNFPYSFIDMVDQDGYTPLLYACMLRLTNIVKILYDAKANIYLIDKHGFTAIHWAAIQLDIFSLKTLCSGVKDINVFDACGRNPLVLLCVEGRDISGTTDTLLLKECTEILLVHQPSCDWRDELGNCVIHYLASSWQFAALELLLNYDSRLVNSVENIFEMTPLLIAARGLSIKRAIGEGQKLLNQTKKFSVEQLHMVEELSNNHAVDTLRCLLKYGAKPNQKDKLGRSFLHVLLEPETQVHWDNEELLQNAISLALSYGARPDEQILGVLKTRFPNLNFGAVIEKWSSLSTIDGKIACMRYCSHFEVRVIYYKKCFKG
jgi:ankyrin repeat protein